MQSFQLLEKSLHLEKLLFLTLVYFCFAISNLFYDLWDLKHATFIEGLYRFFSDVEESRSVQLPQKSIPPKSKPPLSNTGRQAPSSREERKPVSMNGQIQAKAGSQKLVSASKPNLMSVDSRKQLGTNNGAGPGRPVGPKSLPSKMPVSSAEKKASAPGARSSMSGLHKAPPSKLHPSIPRQNLDQKRQFQDSNKGKMMPKQRVDSSRPQV